MASQNVDIARRMFAAIAARDAGEMTAVVDPKVQLFATKTGAETGQPFHLYLGHDGVRDYFEHIGLVWEELEFEPREFRERDENLIALGVRKTRRRKGSMVAEEAAWALRIRDGRIAWARAYVDPAEALRDVPMPGIAVVAGILHAQRNGDIEATLAGMSPKIEFDAPITGALIGEKKAYSGHAGVRRFFEDSGAAAEELYAEIEHYWEVGDHVVTDGRVFGRARDGREIDASAQSVWRLEGGLVVWARQYADVESALRAAGLPAAG